MKFSSSITKIFSLCLFVIIVRYLLEEVEEIPTGTSLKRKLTTDTAPQLSSSVEESAATVTEPVDKPKPAKVQKVAASRKTKVSAKTGKFERI